MSKMIEDGILGHVGILKCVKTASTTHCQLLESTLHLGLTDVPILKRCKLNFQDDNAPSHSAKEMQVFFANNWVRSSSFDGMAGEIF